MPLPDECGKSGKGGSKVVKVATAVEQVKAALHTPLVLILPDSSWCREVVGLDEVSRTAACATIKFNLAQVSQFDRLTFDLRLLTLTASIFEHGQRSFGRGLFSAGALLAAFLATHGTHHIPCHDVALVLSLFRHAIGHDNFQINTEGVVTFWNVDPKTHQRTWCWSIPLKMLRRGLCACVVFALNKEWIVDPKHEHQSSMHGESGFCMSGSSDSSCVVQTWPPNCQDTGKLVGFCAVFTLTKPLTYYRKSQETPKVEQETPRVEQEGSGWSRKARLAVGLACRGCIFVGMYVD
jgi:hypothetical protein